LVRNRRRWGIKPLAVSALFACLPLWAQSSSPSYVLQRSTLDSAGHTAFAPSFKLRFSLGRDATVGVSANDTFILQSGFWSFVGSGPVPVVLAVDRDVSEDLTCDLSWSGNDPPYEIYVAQDCSAVFQSLYATSSDNSLPDVVPSVGGLTCFNVVSMNSPP
jgi:hypothetical protein